MNLPLYNIKGQFAIRNNVWMAYKRKYSSRRKSYRRSRRGKYSRKGSRSFQSRVKKVIMKTAETKMWPFANENQQLYHNTGLAGATYVAPIIFNVWNAIAQGPGKQQRIGDTIIPRGFSLRLWIANKLDRPNIMYRLIVCVLPKTFNNARVTAGSIDIGQPNFAGACGNYMCLSMDTEKGIKVLYDRVFNLQVGNSSQSFANGGLRPAGNLECHTFKKLWIKSKKGSTVKYESNANQDIINKPMAVYLIPYDSYGTLNTDIVGTCAFTGKLYFKDL